MSYKIYFDLDGVLVDLALQSALDISNELISPLKNWDNKSKLLKKLQDYDGDDKYLPTRENMESDLAAHDLGEEKTTWQKLMHKYKWKFFADTSVEWWSTLPKMPNSDIMVEEAIRLVGIDNVYVLTSPANDTTSPEGKLEWVKRNTNIKPENVIVAKNKTPYAQSKSTSILIDDRIKNINGWKTGGGTGILYIGDSLETIKTLKNIVKK